MNADQNSPPPVSDKPFKMSGLEKGTLQAAWAMCALLVIILTISLVIIFAADKSVNRPLLDRTFIPAQVLSWAIVLLGIACFFNRCLWIGLTKSMILNEVVELKWFFEQIGLTEGKWIEFIRQNGLKVFIADQPLPGHVAVQAQATHFFFIAHFVFGYNKNRFWSAVALKQTCLRQEQAAAFLPKNQEEEGQGIGLETVEGLKTQMGHLQQRLVELGKLNKALQDQLTDNGNRTKELEEENESQKKEIQGFALREGKDDKAQKKLMLYTLGLAPIFHQMVARKPDRRDVTKTALADLFKTVMTGQPDLRRLLAALGEKTPLELPDYAGDLLWENLKTLALTNPGGPPPVGNLARLKKIIFAPG
ncbi:hypothetical protein FACS189460_0580 [Deltaproteobacteria bacterium]|nr:hypothetical protein FACS189460_0580 [Deltaproteobacteria bacterium]